MTKNSQDRFSEWLSRAWYEAVGSGDMRHYKAGTNVEVLRERNGVRFYVSKYIAKVDQEGVSFSPYCKGRWWGVKRRNLIPWGERVVVTCTSKQAAMLMRIARQYVKSKTGKEYHFSHTVMNVYVNDSAVWLILLQHFLVEEYQPF